MTQQNWHYGFLKSKMYGKNIKIVVFFFLLIECSYLVTKEILHIKSIRQRGTIIILLYFIQSLNARL